jgi:hypothetical protein
MLPGLSKLPAKDVYLVLNKTHFRGLGCWCMQHKQAMQHIYLWQVDLDSSPDGISGDLPV